MFREPMKLVQDDTKYMRLADFSGGRNTTISPALLNVNESPTAECVSFDQKGTIYPSWGRIKRYEKPFTDRPITGLGEFRKTDGTTRLMIGAGDAVYYDSPNLSWVWEGDKFDNGTLNEMRKDGNKLTSKRKLTFLGSNEASFEDGKLKVGIDNKLAISPGVDFGDQDVPPTKGDLLQTFDLESLVVSLPSLPSGDAYDAAFDRTGTYLAVAHYNSPYITIYKRNGDTFTKLTNPSTLPAGNSQGCAFDPTGTYLAVAHSSSPYITIYKRSGDTFTKLADPSVLPTGTGYGCAFDPTGTYLAVAHSTSPYITIYKRSGDTFTKLPNPDTLPAGTGRGCAFDRTGTYLAVGHYNSPYITIYKRNGDTFTKLTNPSTLPTNEGRGCAFDPTGTYLAVAHRDSPYITIYKRSGDTFTKLPNPSVLPTGIGYGCAFDPTGTYLAVAHDSSPYITIYKRSGDTFTKLPNPDTLPAGTGRGCAFDPTETYLAVGHYKSPRITIYKYGYYLRSVFGDEVSFDEVSLPSLPTGTGYGCAFDPTETYLAVAHSNSPYITIYKRSGDTFTKLPNPATLPPSTGWGCAFDPTGTYLAVAHYTSPYITIYKRSGDTFTKLPNPSVLPTGIGYGCAFDPTGTYLAVAHDSSPYITIYKRSGDTFTKLANPSTLPTNTGFDCAFDPTGTYLAVGHRFSPYITIYKRSGDTFTKLANPSTLPPYEVRGCAFDPTGTYLAVAHWDSPYITIYKRSGDTFTKLANPATLPTGSGYGCAFDRTGTYLAVAHYNSPYITIYKRDSDTFTKLADPTTLPPNNGYGCAFDSTGTYLAVTHSGSPYITVYTIYERDSDFEPSVVGDLYSDGRLVISGEGDMRDFPNPGESPFYNNTLVKSLVIHDGITHLGSYAFCECPNLKEIRNYCGEGQTLGTDVFLNSGAGISDKKAYGIDTNTEFMAAMENSGYKWNDIYSNQTHFELGFKITSLGNLQTLLDLNGVEGYTLVVNITSEGKIEIISPHERVISGLGITTNTDYLLRVVHTPSVIQVFINDELYGEIHDINYVVTNDNPMYIARGVTGYIWGFRVTRNGFEFIRADLAQNLNIICTGTWVSPVVDASNAKDLSTGYASVLTESGFYLVQSRSADSENGPWSDWVPASDAGKLLHEPKPYVQLYIVGMGGVVITSVTMYFDGMPTATLLKDGLTPNAMYCFRTFGDRVIIANGYDPLMAWDGESEAPVLVGGDPPPFQFIEVHQNRLWGWGGPMPSRLRYSNLLDADSWPALNFIDVNPDDGDHPTGLKTYGAYLLLPKSKRIAVLIGDQASNYAVTWLESSFGIQGMNAISSTDKYLSYVAQDGIRFTDMTSSVTAVERLLPDWEKLDKRLLYKAAQIYWGHTLLTALPGPDAVSGNTEVWMYDALRNAWSIRYDWKLSCFLRFNEYGEEVLLAGDSTTGQIYKIVPDPYNEGIPVQYKWKSKDLNFGEPERYKVWPVVFLQVEGEYEQRTLKVRFFVDGRETGGPDLTVPAGKGRIFTFRLVPPQYGAVYGQRLAISLEGSNGVHLITIGYTLRTFSVGVR